MATLRPETTTGWGAFAAWALCGMLWAFSFLSFAGLVTLPVAAILTALLIKYAPDNRDAMGLVAGIGAMVLVIGFLNLGYQPCPESPTIVIMTDEGSFSCGGLDPKPWLAVGFIFLVVAIAVYRLRRQKLVKPS